MPGHQLISLLLCAFEHFRAWIKSESNNVAKMLNVMAQLLLHLHSVRYKMLKFNKKRDKNSSTLDQQQCSPHNDTNVSDRRLKIWWCEFSFIDRISLIRGFIVCSLIKNFYMQNHVSNWHSSLCKQTDVEWKVAKDSRCFIFSFWFD